MKKSVYILIWLTLLAAFVVIGVVTFWLTWPYKIAEQKSPAKILTPVVKNGEEVFYDLEFCKYRDITPIGTRRQIVDGLIYQLPVADPKVLPVGCKKQVASTPIILPECAECFNKEVYLELTAIYQVNPLRKVEVTFTTEKFTIKPRDND